MEFLLGIDIGTSGTKTVLFEERGTVLCSKTVEYPLHQPQNGWAEQNPDDWWKATAEGIRYVLRNSKVPPEAIRGIGLSGQMHGLVMLDRVGWVLCDAIIWCDQRTTEECREITELIGPKRLIEITANPALEGFTASKILWMRKHKPEIYAKCAHILLPKDYIRYRLTGQFASEVSDASGMQLMDIGNRCWSSEVLSKLGIDKALLPVLTESCEVTGKVHREAAGETGLQEGTPVAGGAGDNAAAAIGMGVVREGRAFTSLGTSGVIFAHSDKVKIDSAGRVHTFCSAVPGKWAVMSCTQAAGLSLRWLRDTCFGTESQRGERLGQSAYDRMDRMANQIPAGSERLLYLPYLMGERSPHLDSKARGVFFGLSAMHTRGHLIRAVMEGVAYSQLDCFNVLKEMGLVVDDMLICGGGAKSALWRQMLCDMYGCGIHTIESDEGPAFGAAIIAGVSTGLYRSVEEACDAMIKKVNPQDPDLENKIKYDRLYPIYRHLYTRLKDIYPLLEQS